jgi:uncharacterized SAM-binding protein YcdF (DUF218 family)
LKNVRKIARAAIVLLLIDITFVAVYWFSSVPYSDDYNEAFDCAVVFFHSITKSGLLSEESVKRCNKAMQLFSEKYAGNIICTGGLKINQLRTGSQMMRDYLIQRGINEQNVFTDTVSHSSLSNWRESVKIIKEKGYKKILIISSPSHILRLKYICIEPGLDVKYITYNPDSGVFEIFADCNVEFVKWFFLLVLPESFSDWTKNRIR